jgi:hypothetical protein
MTPASRSFLWATGVGLLAGLAAMWRYPGGTFRDRVAAHYSLTQNFLSDLGMTVSYAGQSNKAGAALFVLSLSLLIVGLGGVLALRASSFARGSRSRGYARAAMTAAAIACACFLGVALTPENRVMGLHVAFTHAAFDLLPVAALMMMLAAHAEEETGEVPIWIVLTAALAAYAWLINWGPSARTVSGHTTQVIAQKAITVTLIGGLLYIHLRSRVRRVTPPAL